MKPYDYYITPEEYEIAERNGISKKRLQRRIWDLAWDKQRAINEPPQKKSQAIPKEIAKRAEQNGIKYETLRQRIHRFGWDYERACTEPLQDKTKAVKKALNAQRRYPKEIMELLKLNGIKYSTFINRINKSGWDLYKAATTPTMTKRESALLAKQKWS